MSFSVRSVVVGAVAVFLSGASVAAAPRLEPSPPPAVPPTVSLVVTAYDEADALPATIDACTGVDHPDDRF